MAQRTRLPSVDWRKLPDGVTVVYTIDKGIFKKPLDDNLRTLFDQLIAFPVYVLENDQ